MIDKNLLGYLSLFFAALSGVPYIFSMVSGKTKPHLFTKLIWGLTEGIAATAQFYSHAGPGAWATGLTALFSITMAILSFRYGEPTITRGDWIALVAGLSAIPLWYFTSDPLPAVIMVTAIDAVAYYPTFRKSYIKPGEEMVFPFVVGNLKHLTSIAAMAAYSATTLFYPVVVLAMNSALISMLVWRRRSIASV